MNQQSNDETPTVPTPEERPRRLVRSSSDRVLAGVAGGLGRYFGVDPIVFRIGFALSLFFGGLGALAYLLLAVFVPTDADPDNADRVRGRLRSLGLWRSLGLVAIALVAIAGLLALAGGSAFVVALGWGIPIGILIIVVGVLLALAGFRGGARWLIPPAVALAIGAGVAAAAGLRFKGGIGQREYHPLTARSIPSGGYRLGVGQLTADLRDLDWRKEKVVRLRVDLGSGQANVFVPAGVCVVGSGHVGIGESELAGERADGAGVDHSVGGGSSAVPRLEFHANVDIGQLRVINSDTASVDTPGYGPGPLHEDTAPLRAAEAKACGSR